MVHFNENFRELGRRISALDGAHQVAFGDLFTPEYMAEYTNCPSIDEFFERGGLAFDSQEDFEHLPKQSLDDLVVAQTQFTSWEEMKQTAAQLWMKRQLGL